MLALTAAVAMDRARLSVVARHNRGSESDFEAIEKAGVVMRPSEVGRLDSCGFSCGRLDSCG